MECFGLSQSPPGETGSGSPQHSQQARNSPTGHHRLDGIVADPAHDSNSIHDIKAFYVPGGNVIDPRPSGFFGPFVLGPFVRLGYEVTAQPFCGLAGSDKYCAQSVGLRAVFRKRLLVAEESGRVRERDRVRERTHGEGGGEGVQRGLFQFSRPLQHCS